MAATTVPRSSTWMAREPAVTSPDAVRVIRWPDQRDARAECRRHGIPCLIVVDEGVDPPFCTDPLEDWVRAPIAIDDVQARIRVLVSRAGQDPLPVLDPPGTLRYRDRSVSVSTVQSMLLDVLIGGFREVVERGELEERLARRAPAPSPNSLDLHIMRLRRRLSPVDLVIRTAWGRGYALEPDGG